MTGVHRPASRKMPHINVSRVCGKVIVSEDFAARPAIPKQIKVMPRQLRSSSRPTPGQLFGKVENRRCRALYQLDRMEVAPVFESPNRALRHPLFEGCSVTKWPTLCTLDRGGIDTALTSFGDSSSKIDLRTPLGTGRGLHRGAKRFQTRNAQTNSAAISLNPP